MKTVSITSGKGGVGKSCVTVNLGVELSRAGKRVLLFDADMGLANLDILCGINGDHSVQDVLEGTKTIPEILLDGPAGLKVLPATSGILKMERLTQPHLIRLTHDLGRLAEDFDLLLVDTGAGLTENVLFFNTCVDEILLVTTPEPTSLTDAYALIKILATEHQPGPISLLVNMATNAEEGERVYTRLQNVCTMFLERELTLFGTLVRDSALNQSIKDRQPMVIGNPTSPFARNIIELAHKFDEVFTTDSGCLGNDLWKQLFEQGGALARRK